MSQKTNKPKIIYIAEAVGFEIDTEQLVENINKNHSYRFGGNGMRKEQITSIRRDEQWVGSLPLVYRVAGVALNRVVLSQ